MFKNLLALLGVGLIGLWIISAGLGVRSWMMWTDGGLGVVSVACAVALPNAASSRVRSGVAGALAVALLGTWIAGLVLGSHIWLDWTTLGFAALYFLLARSARTETSGGREIERRKAA